MQQPTAGQFYRHTTGALARYGGMEAGWHLLRFVDGRTMRVTPQELAGDWTPTSEQWTDDDWMIFGLVEVGFTKHGFCQTNRGDTMNDLSNAERETMLNMPADDRSGWIVFSDDPVMMRKLEKANAEFVRNVGAGKEYRLKAEQVTFRRGKKQLSEEAKAKLSERMRRLRQTTGSA